jgi:uncharacterized protein (DUF488 family)
VEIYTIGFTQKSAAQFFNLLKRHQIRRLVDVRLNNVSQLAGFSKRDDLAYFLGQLIGAEYRHEPLLAPTQQMLDDLKKRRGSWVDYEKRFLALMRERRIEHELDPALFEERTVLLCSEATPDYCHRRLVVEYLDEHWGDVRAVHL